MNKNLATDANALPIGLENLYNIVPPNANVAPPAAYPRYFLALSPVLTAVPLIFATFSSDVLLLPKPNVTTCLKPSMNEPPAFALISSVK